VRIIASFLRIILSLYRYLHPLQFTCRYDYNIGMGVITTVDLWPNFGQQLVSFVLCKSLFCSFLVGFSEAWVELIRY